MKQLPIPFLKIYMHTVYDVMGVNLVYDVMFCKQKSSSALYHHSLGSNLVRWKWWAGHFYQATADKQSLVRRLKLSFTLNELLL